MKTNQDLKDIMNLITNLRIFNDATSNIIRLKIIDELSMQIRMNLIIENKEEINYNNKCADGYDHRFTNNVKDNYCTKCGEHK